MGFPVGYTELFIPRLLLHSLSFMGYIRTLISTLFRFLGLPDFIEPTISWPDPPEFTPTPDSFPFSAILSGEILPVVKFSDLIDPPESCAVCLYEFEGEDEIRRLTNCRHIFHRNCVDRWMMGYHQMTCPLCRTSVIPEDMQETFNRKVWADSGLSDFHSDYFQIDAL